jgi:hypothetical protein
VITPDTDIVRKAKMIPQAPIETGHPLYENNLLGVIDFSPRKNFKGKSTVMLSTTFIIHIFMILCKESVNFMRKTICRLGQFWVLYGKGLWHKAFSYKNQQTEYSQICHTGSRNCKAYSIFWYVWHGDTPPHHCVRLSRFSSFAGLARLLLRTLARTLSRIYPGLCSSIGFKTG